MPVRCPYCLGKGTRDLSIYTPAERLKILRGPDSRKRIAHVLGLGYTNYCELETGAHAISKSCATIIATYYKTLVSDIFDR